MFVNERKKLYEDFVNWVKEEWKYFIPGTLFEKALDGGRGSFKIFATSGLKDENKMDEIFAKKDMYETFSYFTAYSLNKYSGTGFKKFIVEENEFISNAYIADTRNKKVKVAVFIKENAPYALAKMATERIKQAIKNSDLDYLKENGFSNTFCRHLDDARVNYFTSASNENEADNDFIDDLSIFWLSRKDYHFFKEGDFEVMSLPAIFLYTTYRPEGQINDNDNDFHVSQSTDRFIDINIESGVYDRVFIAPIKVVELVEFVKEVSERLNSVDSLFSLNVRDRKNKNKKLPEAIIKTINEYPEEFLMLNNGITAIVDKIDTQIYGSQDQKTLKLILKNIQIINGQQTTYTLFEEYVKNGSTSLKDSYTKAEILLKAYVVGKQQKDTTKIYNRISNASNSQIAIKSKDLMSTWEFNKDLREVLLNLGVNYEFRDGNSDFLNQLKDLPKTKLDKLVKMHYITLTNEVWKKGSIGKVFETLTDMSKPRPGVLQDYKKLFQSKSSKELSRDLSLIAELQLFFEAKKALLGKESQALDLLVYIAFLLDKAGRNYFEIDVEDFARTCSQIAKDENRNNFYKSAKYLPALVMELLKKEGLEETKEFAYFKNYVDQSLLKI